MGDGEDNPTDYCAHGRIRFRIDNTVFVDKGEQSWTVSSAALYLLRTVTNDHSPESSVAESNYLIPCCGFTIHAIPASEYRCVTFGCGAGVDPTVKHRGSNIEVVWNGSTEVVSTEEWASAVCRFADEVESFYGRSAPKTRIEDEHDRVGWEIFWAEWSERLGRARDLAVGE